MKSFALDGTNDLSLDDNSGEFQMDHDKNEINQKIINAVSTNQNELSWNSDIGLNQLDLIYNADNPKNMQAIITDYLQKLFGDNEIISVNVINPEFDDKTRTLNFSAKITLNINNELLKIQPAFNLGGE